MRGVSQGVRRPFPSTNAPSGQQDGGEREDKKLDHSEVRNLVWMLAQMRAMVETQALQRLEQQLEEIAPSIEGGNHGFSARLAQRIEALAPRARRANR